MDKRFYLETALKPKGDQPSAISSLSENIRKGKKFQTLLGVTGSGKTFTLACMISELNRPVLVISHNKTLAAQLYSEFKEFFPSNAVEYFVSYYDYYQPEAYIPKTDTYIEKDAAVNERLDCLRLSATSSLMSRRDVIVVASVSCIYNLGSPSDYKGLVLYLNKGQEIEQEDLYNRLIELQYERNDFSFQRGMFRARGESIDVYPAYRDTALRINFSDNKIEGISEIDPVSCRRISDVDKIALYPAKHFLASKDSIEPAKKTILWELEDRLKVLNKEGRNLEAERLKKRTLYDLEMLEGCGWCHGIENYSRHLSQREPGSRPYCLLDYFPDDFITLIDESHVTMPQLKAMYNQDKARKETLVEHGFRLPSCLDNRPLKFEEFMGEINQGIFISATPAEFELNLSKGNVVEQVIRPTGLIDPEVEVRPVRNQIDDLISEIKNRAEKGQRTLVTTLTKRMAEDLAYYLKDEDIKAEYLHSDIDTIDRTVLLTKLRKKEFDCLIGVNLLREGLDLPEVSLVAILDADKEGFLRSSTSLIQVSGRAARNIEGKVIMYADRVTDSMRKAIDESLRRRKQQLKFNKDNNITPQSVEKSIREGIEAYSKAEVITQKVTGEDFDSLQLRELISRIQKEMLIEAKNLHFEKAAVLRDKIEELTSLLKEKKLGD